MTDTDKTVETAAAMQAADPVPAMIATLFDKQANGAKAKDARALFSQIAGSGRPWEQLPSRMKSAARADARRLTEKGGSNALTSAGYSPQVAARLLRDIGR